MGYKPEEFISNFSSYLPNNELNLLAREYTIKSIQGETVPPYELEIIDKKGDLHTFRITKSATIDQQGKIIGIEGIAQGYNTVESIAYATGEIIFGGYS